MFNRSFLTRLVPECNEIWFLGRTRTYLKKDESFISFANKTTKKLSIEQNHFEKIENQTRQSHMVFLVCTKLVIITLVAKIAKISTQLKVGLR